MTDYSIGEQSILETKQNCPSNCTKLLYREMIAYDSIFKINFNCKFISALQYATNERYDVRSRFPQEQNQVCKVSICDRAL